MRGIGFRCWGSFWDSGGDGLPGLVVGLGGFGDVVVFGGDGDDLAGEVFALEADGAVFGFYGYGVAVGYVAGDGADSDAQGGSVSEDGFGQLGFEFGRA